MEEVRILIQSVTSLLECIEEGEMLVKNLRTNEQRADILTMSTGRIKFEEIEKDVRSEGTTRFWIKGNLLD